MQEDHCTTATLKAIAPTGYVLPEDVHLALVQTRDLDDIVNAAEWPGRESRTM